jgi:hypothetical protein
MSKKMILIEGDANDGDYIEKCSEIEQENFDIIFPLFEKIKANNGKWETHDGGEDPYDMYGLTDEQNDILCGLIPRGEYGIHSIVHIKVLEVVSIERFV